jgi:hypothetical protein
MRGYHWNKLIEPEWMFHLGIAHYTFMECGNWLFSVPRDFNSVLMSYTRQGLRVIAAAKRQLNTNLRWKDVDDMSR